MIQSPELHGIDCVILGAGGHARVLLDCIGQSGVARKIVLVDANPELWNTRTMGVAVLGGDEWLPKLAAIGCRWFAVGVGTVNASPLRRKLFSLGVASGIDPMEIRHPSALVSSNVTLGAGCQLMAGSIVCNGVKLGSNVIVNTGAIIEHDCRIGDNTHIATGARLTGGVVVENGAHIGAGATVCQNLTIEEEAVVGAGAVVLRRVLSRTVVVGVPAKVMKSD